MEEKKLSWPDRLLEPIVNAKIFGKKLIPTGVTPNHLSMARAAMVLPAAAALWHGLNVLAVVFLSLAVVLDILDGAVARIREQTSSNGEWIDAYADKMLIGGMLILYGWSYFPYYLVVAVLAIEGCLIVGRPYKLRKGRSGKANIFGKIKMWCQSAAVIGLAAGASWTILAANFFLGVAVVFAALSLLGHIRDMVGKSWKLFVAACVLGVVVITAVLSLVFHIRDMVS